MLATIFLPLLALASTALALPAPNVEERAPLSLPRGFRETGKCLKDPSMKDRLFKGAKLYDPKMNYFKCANFCYDNGWQIAGLENGVECFCGAKQDLNRAQVLDSSKCNVECGGDHSRKCGGPYALTVLETDQVNTPIKYIKDVTVPGFPKWQYQNQCNQDMGPPNRLLPFVKKMDRATASWQTCVGICEGEKKNYDLAGVEFGGECYCGYAGDFNAKKPKGSTDCKIECTGANAHGQLCGGAYALSIIYKGGIQQH